ncbi:MAG TPA: hypothetical protein DCS93_39260 [Microscillaceae bacterium]|nr:hypothetical protein [Microscillaceae bacterium]
MKPINKEELEEINLEGWNLIKDTSTDKVYRKANREKRLEVFENYTLEKNFKDEKLNGVTVGRMNKPFLHYPNYKSKIYLIERYHEGNQEGLSQSFYEDGASVQQEWKNDHLHGKWEAWLGNGQKEKEKYYINGELSGEQYEWYENGQLKLKENFLDGVQVGESVKYLNNGRLKRKKFYKNGKVEGVVYELWDYRGKVVDGGVYSETEYQNDIPHGKEVVYYPDKAKMREGYFQNGKEEGERIWWNKNGIILIKENYKNGELEGERYIYDELGKLESVQRYEKGERIS